MIPEQKQIGLRPDQLELRRHRITATDMAAILGLSSWANPLTVYADKVAPQAGPRPEPTLPQLFGLLDEPGLAYLYQRERPDVKIIEPAKTYEDPDTILAATPDRIARKGSDEWGLEIKSVSGFSREDWGEPGTDEVPDRVIVQATVQMAVLGWPFVDVPVRLGKFEFAVYHIDRDEDLVCFVRNEAERFWRDFVLTQTPPPPDYTDLTAEALQQLYPRHREDSLIEATPEQALLAARLESLIRHQRDVEEAIDLVKNTLKYQLGENEGLLLPSGDKITWKKAKDSRRVDWKAVVEEIGAPQEVIERHTTVRPGSRRFIRPRKWTSGPAASLPTALDEPDPRTLIAELKRQLEPAAAGMNGTLSKEG